MKYILLFTFLLLTSIGYCDSIKPDTFSSIIFNGKYSFVKTPLDGTVVSISGCIITLRHIDKGGVIFFTQYCNTSRVFVSLGDFVTAGSSIGVVDTSDFDFLVLRNFSYV